MKPLLLFLNFIMLSLSTIYAQNGIELKSEIDKAIAYEVNMDTSKITGWVIGCIDHDSTWVFGYGRTSKVLKSKPNGQTIFEIGGVTKSYTAMVAQIMAERGILHLDSTLNIYLKPEQRFLMGNRITLLQLMTHTSGLPKFPDGFGSNDSDKNQPYADYTEEMLFEYLKTVDSTDLKKRGKYLYSHLNHAILEKIIANKGGSLALKNFERRIDDSTITYAQGYNPAQVAVPNWQFNETFKFSVGIQANMDELLDFMKSNLGVKDTSLYTILRGTQEAIFKTGIDKNTSVGKAWHVLKYKNRPLICIQSGSTNGQSAFFAFVPETKTGVVILANSRLVQGKLGMLILKILNFNWKR